MNTNSDPLWTILIATIGRREQRFLRLLDHLMPQVKAYDGQITVLAYWNNFEQQLGKTRQDLVEESTGRYVNFIDDDDWIPEDYCSTIFTELQKDVDYVGFNVRLIHDSGPADNKLAYHSLQYTGWSQDNDGYYRDVSHLNPVKREYAGQVKFPDMSAGEDYSWAMHLRPLLKTESYIRGIMYEYRHSVSDSTWNGLRDDGKTYTRPAVNYEHFAYHSKSKETNK